MTYFGTLNYTLANEDTAFELSLLPSTVAHVGAIAGSGSRVLPLVGRAHRRVTCIDVSAPQLCLTELRIEAARALDLDEYRALLGYPPSPASSTERRGMVRALPLSPRARAFLDDHFERTSWRAPLYDGRWERTFAKLSRLNRALTGEAGARLFDAHDLPTQRAYLASGFPRRRFRQVLRLLGNAAVFNALLYRGHFPKKNTPGSHFEHYEAAFRRLFERTVAQRNFFLQLVFFGEVRFPEGCPVEAEPTCYARTKQALRQVQIDYHLGDALEVVRSLPEPLDFLSLSDIASYFAGETERTFLQRLGPALAPGALTVVRTYLHEPRGVDTSGFSRETVGEDVALDENVGVYSFDVYRRT